MKFRDYLIHPDATIIESIKTLEKRGTQILFVVDANQRLLGSISNGDIRRAILRDTGLSAQVSSIMNQEPVTLPKGYSTSFAESMLRNCVLQHLPVLSSDGRLTEVFTTDSQITETKLSNTAVLMAGGLGSRLGELTRDCPKPLLNVGGRPILQTTLELLRDGGFRRFVLTVNYLADKIVEYFGDGSEWDVQIDYIHEKQRSGTAGALRELHETTNQPVVVVNGDVLTRVNFKEVLNYHTEHDAEATMCVHQFDHQVPYGVVELEDNLITAVVEKPISRHFVNSGVYVINPSGFKQIPIDCIYNMTDLFDALRNKGKRTIAYPISEFWLDVGRPGDFQAANDVFDTHFNP